MKRSERMAKLKAQRELKMKQRRARLAAKKAGSNKRAFSDSTIKKQASEVYKKALEQGGGAFAAKKRREFLKDAQYKMDTKSTAPAKPKPPRGETRTSGIPFRSAGAIGVTPRNKPKPPAKTSTPTKPKPPTVTPRNKPKPPTKPKPRGGDLSQMFKGAVAQKEARMANNAKELTEYQKSQKELLENQGKKAFANMEKQNEGIKNFFNKYVLGEKTQLKSGGRVKKGYKKGCSVKKGYKSGGKVRGAGCVTKGVRPCKMR
ncbi:hypothetical protein N9D02_10490 [Emcibacteraceae bacterium]|nr:hypothetical protein [Emcibacteraceae bacterium]